MPPLATDVVEIGEAMEARLNLLKVVPDPTLIIWSARRGDVPHIKGAVDIVIRPRRGQDIRSFEQGGQRYGMVLIRTIDLVLRTSLPLDDVGSDKIWLRNHVNYENAIIDAFAGQMLTNALQQDYLTCPIHYLGTTEETKEEGPDKPKHLWGNSVLSFEVHFKGKITLNQLT